MGKGQNYVVIGIILTVILCLYTFTSGGRQVDIVTEGYQEKDETRQNTHSNKNVNISGASPSARHTASKPKGKSVSHTGTLQNNENRTRSNGSILKKLREQSKDRNVGRTNISTLLKNITNSRKSGFTKDRLSDGMLDGDAVRKNIGGSEVNAYGIRLRDDGVKDRKNDSVGGNLGLNPGISRRLSGARKVLPLPRTMPNMTDETLKSDSLSNDYSLSVSYSDYESVLSSSEDKKEDDRNNQKKSSNFSKQTHNIPTKLTTGGSGGNEDNGENGDRSDNDGKKQREGAKVRTGMQTSWKVKIRQNI